MTFEMRQRLEHIAIVVFIYAMGFFSGVLVSYLLLKIWGVIP